MSSHPSLLEFVSEDALDDGYYGLFSDDGLLDLYCPETLSDGDDALFGDIDTTTDFFGDLTSSTNNNGLLLSNEQEVRVMSWLSLFLYSPLIRSHASLFRSLRLLLLLL